MNTFKSTLLLVTLTLILVLAGDWIGGQNGMVFAFLLSAAMNFVAYFYSDKIALGILPAQPATREQLPAPTRPSSASPPKTASPCPKSM